MVLTIEQLRKLTTQEQEEINNLNDIGSTDTMQVLLGIIANDLAADENEEFSWMNLKNKIQMVYPCSEHPSMGYPNNGPASILGVLDQWIRQCMVYKKKGLVKDLDPKLRGMESNIRAIVFGFSDQIFGLGHGYVGKKQDEIMVYYDMVNDYVKQKKNTSLSESKEDLYRYVLTCLEYCGFQKEEHKIKMRHIPISAIQPDDIEW